MNPNLGYVAIWCLLFGFFLYLELGVVFLLISLLVLIWWSLDRNPQGKSKPEILISHQQNSPALTAFLMSLDNAFLELSHHRDSMANLEERFLYQPPLLRLRCSKRGSDTWGKKLEGNCAFVASDVSGMLLVPVG